MAKQETSKTAPTASTSEAASTSNPAFAVILAGGSGTRLWPASRRARPKQLLSLTADKLPMVTAAVETARAVAGDRIVVVTSELLLEATREALVGLPVTRTRRPTMQGLG